MAAASVTVLLGSAIGYTFLKTPKADPIAIVKKAPPAVSSNYNKATLTLASGQTMLLDDATNGVIARDGGAAIQKTADGEILYSTTDESTATGSINAVSTPKGGQYQISLPDGSKVWLNALSTLKFPTTFKGKDRVVELTGEAYFEITKNKTRPFRVKMPNETLIEVLGTHFNIMAYPEEHTINATLLEGSISVTKGDLSKMVTPGEMARITDKITLQNVDTEDIISWKNGLFRFERADVRTVMREIERWYSVDVEYEEGLPENRISGYISRSSQLTEVLKMLELSGLKLRTQGNKIKVFKN